MCGIAGIWFKQAEGNDPQSIVKMTDALVHRGPDAQGHWSNGTGLFLGHRRLSILDLDPRSNQPFEWLEKYVVTFNGEIYNYIELRKELQNKGYFFYTDSDTEVLCAAYNEWDVACLERFDGMFAFALFDKRKQQLFCARDRFGEKPFYYSQTSNGFYFASEMKALWSVGIAKRAREKMVYHFLADDLVEDVENPTNTFFEGIHKLAASHFLLYEVGKPIRQQRYYEIDTTTKFEGSFSQAVIGFQEHLYRSVERRMRADVAIGSSLSGGLDSSAITAIMNEFQPGNATFSARFNGFEKDEGTFIDEVNRQLSTKPFAVFPNLEDIEQQLDKLVYHQEEPFQSGSIFAQFKVYELARKNKHLVILDGQGADELLGGYFMYLLPYYYELPTGKRAPFLKQMEAQQGIRCEPTRSNYVQFNYPKVFSTLHQLKQKVKPQNNKGIHTEFSLQNTAKVPFKTFPDLKESLKHSLSSQGLEKLLRFSDRNAMAHSIEARLPFLSHELVDFVMQLPSSFFFEQGWTKSLLRHAMNQQLSDGIVWRKDKIGFEAPHREWLKSDRMHELVQDAKRDMQHKKWITDSYDETWKMVVLTKVLADAK